MVLLGYTAGVQAQEAGTISICGHDMEVGNDWGPESGLGGLSAGHIIFTDETHVTFDNVELNFNSTSGHDEEAVLAGDLEIELVGTNTINATGTAIGLGGRNLSFTGSGTLEIISENKAICISGDFTISDAQINAKGTEYGFEGWDSDIYLEGLAVLQTYGGTACVKDVLSINGDVVVSSPSGAQFNESKKTFVDSSDDPIKGKWVKIESAIDIDAKIFPDENFLKYMTETTLGADNKLTKSEINSVTELNLYKKKIANLQGIELFTALQILKCGFNSLTELDLSKNTALKTLYCEGNQFETLDVSNNTALTELDCSQNKLTTLDVSKNTKLTSLYCSQNSIRGDNMTTLIKSLPSWDGSALYVYNNETYTGNTITPAQVEAAKAKGWTAMQWDESKESWVNYEGEEPYLTVDETNFPDEKFLAWLKTQDYGVDRKLTNAELTSIESLDVSNQGIANMKGIEFFTELLTLDCSQNKLMTLDVSQNTKLSSLYCSQNFIREDDMTALINTLPTRDGSSLYVYNNETSTGNLITPEQVAAAKAKGWDVMKTDENGYWVDYEGEDPYITIDATYFPDVNFRKWLIDQDYGADKKLTDAEIASVTNMNVSKQSILDLKGIEYFTALTTLDCSQNKLTSLDLSKNTKLWSLYCSQNSLRGDEMTALINSLPTKDGSSLYVYNNETSTGNLITPEQVAAAKAKGWTAMKWNGVDLWVDYEGENPYITVDEENFPDEKFLAWLIKQDYGADKKLTDAEIASIKEIDVSNQGIANLEGIEFFTALTTLDCSQNQLTTLDLSENTNLWSLYCSQNSLRGDNMTALINSLPKRDGSSLYVYNNETYTGNTITPEQVAAAKAKGWTAMKWNGVDLWVDYEGENPYITVDETNFPDENFLAWLMKQDYGKDRKLTDAEIADVKEMNVSKQGIANLKGIEFFTALTTLDCSQNKLTTLDLSKNTKVWQLYCWQNSLRGDYMTALINSLPTKDGSSLYVYNKETSTGNTITPDQVAAAKKKSWEVMQADDDGNWVDFGGEIPAIDIASDPVAEIGGEKYYEPTDETKKATEETIETDIALSAEASASATVNEDGRLKFKKGEDVKFVLPALIKGRLLKVYYKGLMSALASKIMPYTHKLRTRGTDEIEIVSGEEYEVLEDGDLVITVALSETECVVSSITVTEAEPAVESESIKITDAKQVPYCSKYNLDFTDKPELKAYVATGYDKAKGTIWLTRVKQIPAQTGFLLIGDAGEYDIPVAKSASNAYYKNMFKGTLEDITIQTTDGDYTNYYLSKGESGVGFYKVTKAGGVKIGANRCYLPILTDIPADGAEGDAEVIKVSAAKQVPYYTSKNVDFTSLESKGVKAYTATGYNYTSGTIWLTRVKKVPAKTGVLIIANEAGEYSVPTTSVQSIYENMFTGSEKAQTIYTTETIDGVDYVNYYLSNGTSGIGFYKVTKTEGVSMGANRSYLQVPYRATSGARGMYSKASSSFTKMVISDNDDDVIAIPVLGGMTGDDDETTGIEVQSSVFNVPSNNVYYNLQGQRVDKPGKGLYIKNGRKVVIK